MTILRVQTKTGTSSGNNATLSITMDSTPTEGNLLILCFGSYGVTSISSITQTGVTWTSVEDQAGATTNVGLCSLWKGVVGSGANAALTIDVNDANNQYLAACVAEYSGLSGTVENSTSAQFGSVASGSTGTVNCAAAGNLVIISADTYSTGTPTADNDFALIARYNSIGHGAYFELNGAGSGDISSTISLSPSDFLTLCIAAFTPASAPASGQQLFCLLNEMGY